MFNKLLEILDPDTMFILENKKGEEIASGHISNLTNPPKIFTLKNFEIEALKIKGNHLVMIVADAPTTLVRGVF